MEEFGTGFLTGFMNRTSEGIDKRKAEADEYFQEQMDIARTRGLEARNKMKTQMQGGITAAQQLKAVGVPQDLVVAIAKQNPDDIPTFLTQVQKLQSEGVQADEAFFRKLIKVHGDVGDPNESIEQAFQRIYEPLSAMAASDPEMVNQDPEGSIFAAMLGFDAQDRVRERLATEEVADGMTADQLIAYGDNPQLNTGGGPTVVMDMGLAGETLRDLEESRKEPKEPKELSISDREKLVKAADDRYTYLKEEWENKNEVMKSEAGEAFPEAAIRRQAFLDVSRDFGEIGEMPGLKEDYLNPQAEAPEEAPLPEQLPDGRTLIEQLPDGTAVYMLPDGTKRRYKNETVRALLSQ